MIFNVRASTSVGIAGFARDTAKTAIEKALELIRDGNEDVVITTPDDERYGPDRFDEMLRKYGPE